MNSTTVVFLVIGIATLSGIIIYSNTANAVQVDRYWSVLEPFSEGAIETIFSELDIRV